MQYSRYWRDDLIGSELHQKQTVGENKFICGHGARLYLDQDYQETQQGGIFVENNSKIAWGSENYYLVGVTRAPKAPGVKDVKFTEACIISLKIGHVIHV